MFFFATNEGKTECTTCELATWLDTGIGQLAIDVSNSVPVKIYRNAAHTPRWDPQSDLKERRKTFNVFLPDFDDVQSRKRPLL